jgi:hypothetical protein
MLVGAVIPLALDFILQNPGHPDIPVYELPLVLPARNPFEYDGTLLYLNYA